MAAISDKRNDLPIKVQYECHTRRFKLDSYSQDQLITTIYTIFPSLAGKQVSLTYLDEDNDLCEVTTSIELEECISVAHAMGRSTVKLMLEKLEQTESDQKMYEQKTQKHETHEHRICKENQQSQECKPEQAKPEQTKQAQHVDSPEPEVQQPMTDSPALQAFLEGFPLLQNQESSLSEVKSKLGSQQKFILEKKLQLLKEYVASIPQAKPTQLSYQAESKKATERDVKQASVQQMTEHKADRPQNDHARHHIQQQVQQHGQQHDQQPVISQAQSLEVKDNNIVPGKVKPNTMIPVNLKRQASPKGPAPVAVDPAPAVAPQPAPNPDGLYSVQLYALRNMGFDNTQECVEALKRFDGDLMRACNWLLGHAQA